MKELTYYILDLETDRKKVGKFPQVDTVEGLNKEKLDFFYSLNSKRFPVTMPALQWFSFEKATKATDVIGNGYIDLGVGIFINEKFKTVIAQYTTVNVRYYKAEIKKAGQILSYFLLYILDSTESIDFHRSTFGAGDVLGRPTGIEFMVADSRKLEEKVQELIETNKLVIPISICLNQKLDLVRIPYEPSIFISEELKARLAEEKLTGFKVEETAVKFFID